MGPRGRRGAERAWDVLIMTHVGRLSSVKLTVLKEAYRGPLRSPEGKGWARFEVLKDRSRPLKVTLGPSGPGDTDSQNRLP